MPNKQSIVCRKCGKRQTVHKTGHCEVCRSNAPEYKQRKIAHQRAKKRLSNAPSGNNNNDQKDLSPSWNAPFLTETSPQPPLSESQMKNGEGTNYSDSIHLHIREFLIRRGIISPQSRGFLSLQELQLHLNFLLKHFPCPDLSVGNTMREVMDVYLLFIAKCHLQDLNYQRSISAMAPPPPQISPSPSFEGLNSISNFPILSSDRLLPYPVNNPIPFIRIPRSPSSSSDFEGIALSRSEEDSPRSPSPLLPSVSSMVISNPSSTRVAPQKSLSLESLLSGRIDNRPSLPFPYSFSSQMQVHNGGSALESLSYASQHLANR